MSAALHQTIVIFVGLVAGFFLRKRGILSATGTKELTAVTLNIFLPGMLLVNILSNTTEMKTGDVLFFLALSTGMYLIGLILGKLFAAVTKAPKADKGVYEFGALASNAGFMGIPVCLAVFGSKCSLYAALTNIPFNLLTFSLGVYLLAGKATLKRILNPSFITSIIGVAIYLLGFSQKMPAIITDIASFLGQATTVCAMVVIGSTLATVPLGSIFKEWRFIPYLILRLFGIAAVTYLLLRFVNIPQIAKAVIVMMAAMPVATNATMLSNLYGGNTTLASKIVFLSHALAIVTIPLWGAFLT
ncbi:MAG: AEC family transporter [Oscillospiraceae bacterium]|nr:AEC family transporter [Oscillospiraceae bacterium]